MSDQVTERPAICLNMIVRNEAHIVREVLDAAAPYISSFVVVDTGSDDGTQDVIRSHMADLGIPGKVHDRPWRDFGHNRSEALTLAQGHGDYIWVIDADDTVVGTLDFTDLNADVYWLRHSGNDDNYWRPQLFRNGFPVRYVGVVHEHAQWDFGNCVDLRLEGDYYIESRRLGARNLDPQKYVRDRDLLLAEVERNPDDARSVFYLAQSYFDMKDFGNARKWYARRAEMGDWAEEVYYSMWRVAESMALLGEPWPEVQDAHLRAWEFRPTRAEPLYIIARRYREDERYHLGYLFAERASEIPYPEADHLFVRADIYAWRALDERAVCASWIDRQTEAFTLCRRVLACPDLPDEERHRVTGNRDVCAATMIEAASPYPDAEIEALTSLLTTQADVTVTLIAGPHLEATELTLNSFLHCCTDLSKAGHFLVLDAGLSAADRAALTKRYEFLEFVDARPGEGPGAQLALLRAHVHTRLWLHLAHGWRFFAPDNLLTRLSAVLDAEPEVFQVGINYADATKLTGTCATGPTVRRNNDTGRYLLTDAAAHGPAMFDTTRLDQAGELLDTDLDPLTHLSQRAAAAGLHTATLDEVLCIWDLELPWTTSAAVIVNELLTAGTGRHFAELTTASPSANFAAVVADSKVSVPYSSTAHDRLDADFLAADPPDGGYDVIFLDTWREPDHMLDTIERCLPKLSDAGVLVVDGSNPPGAWHQRLTGESDHESVGHGQVRQAVIEFRVLHPASEVFTVEAGWGCTVIRPSREARHQTAFERERRLLNLVGIDQVRHQLDADRAANSSTPS